MPKEKPEYEALDEFNNIASQLVSRYPEVFGDLNHEEIRCVMITNKDRGEKGKVWEVKSVSYPIRMDCPYAYYVIIYQSDWVVMDQAHQAALVADVLHAIPEDTEGKVNSFDLKGYGNMMRTLGVDFLDRNDIPDLLTENVEWKIR